MNSKVMSQPFKLGQVAIVNHLTIDDKIRFWQNVMQYAKDRGIDVYWYTWNIWSGVRKANTASPKTATIPRPSLTSARVSVKPSRPIRCWQGSDYRGREHEQRPGALRSRSVVMEDLRRRHPRCAQRRTETPFRLIHRYNQTSQSQSIDAFKQYPGPFDFSFKYSVAHMYSEPNPPHIVPVLAEMPKNLRTWLEVRNDDIYSFRWGDPDFARAYIRTCRDRIAWRTQHGARWSHLGSRIHR